MSDQEILKFIEEEIKEIDKHAALLDSDILKTLKEDLKKFKNDINLHKKSD